jgi:two-component system response regulator HydG
MIRTMRHETEELWEHDRVLVVDSHDSEARGVVRHLEAEGFRPTYLRNEEDAFNLIDEETIDGVIAEIRTPRIDGIRLLHIARLRNPETCVIFIAGPDDIGLATRGVSEGAYDFQTRPLNLEKLVAVLRRGQGAQRLADRLSDLNRRLDRKYGLGNIIGNSAAISGVLAKIRQVGSSEASVLIRGETGTGKELIATAIHQNSGRKDGPLLKLDCGDLAEGLVESELFGHVRGAFTDAVSDRQGRFELADGGTLFLDGVGELGARTQAKLLRVLEDGRFYKLGAERARKVDVRLIASTQVDLRELVQQGRFRGDLFYRLNVISLEMPALRHRRQDIPLLLDHFLGEAATTAGKPAPVLAPAAMNRLMRYAWPGNVRELKNVATGLVFAHEGTRPLDVGDLPPFLQELPADDPGIWVSMGTPFREVERRMLETALLATGFDRKAAARMLGMSLRTLYRRISEYGIEGPAGRATRDGSPAGRG